MLDSLKRHGPPQTLRVYLYGGIAILYALVMIIIAPRLWWVGLIALVLAAGLAGWGIWSGNRRKMEWDRYVHVLFQNIDEVTREAVLRYPSPWWSPSRTGRCCGTIAISRPSWAKTYPAGASRNS